MTDIGELPASTADSDGPSLATGRISIQQAILFGLSALFLVGSLGTQGSYGVGGAGNTYWLADIVAAAFSLLLATIVTKFARRHIVSGSLMSYLRLEIGHRSAIFGGSALFAGYSSAMAAYLASTLYYTFSALSSAHVDQPSTAVLILVAAVVTAISCLLVRRGVAVSVNVTIVLGWIGLPLVVIIMVAALIKSGVHVGDEISLTGFTFSPFVAGIVLAFGLYAGFEGLTALAKETKDPRRTIPRVLLILVATCGVVSLVSIMLTYPLMSDNQDAIFGGESPLRIMADLGGVGWLGPVTDAIIAVASLAGFVAYMNDSSRIVATAATDGYLPRPLSRIDRRHHTPSTATLFMGPFAFALFAIFLIWGEGGAFGALIQFALLLGYAWLLAYVAVAVAGALSGWREGKPLEVVVGTVTALFMGFVLVYSYDHLASGIGSVLGWTVLGLIAVVFVYGLASQLRSTPVIPLDPK